MKGAKICRSFYGFDFALLQVTPKISRGWVHRTIINTASTAYTMWWLITLSMGEGNEGILYRRSNQKEPQKFWEHFSLKQLCWYAWCEAHQSYSSSITHYPYKQVDFRPVLAGIWFYIKTMLQSFKKTWARSLHAMSCVISFTMSYNPNSQSFL